MQHSSEVSYLLIRLKGQSSHSGWIALYCFSASPEFGNLQAIDVPWMVGINRMEIY